MVEMAIPMMGNMGPADFGTSYGGDHELNVARASVAIAKAMDRGGVSAAVSTMAKDLDTYEREFNDQWVINPWKMKVAKNTAVVNRLTGKTEAVDTIVSLDGQTVQDATDPRERNGEVWRATHRISQMIAGLSDGATLVWASPKDETGETVGKNNRVYKAERRGDDVHMTAYTLGGEEGELRKMMETLSGEKHEREKSLLEIIAIFRPGDQRVSHEGIFRSYSLSIDGANKGRLAYNLQKFSAELKISDEERVKEVELRQICYEKKLYKEMFKDKTVVEAFGIAAQGLVRSAKLIEKQDSETVADRKKINRNQDRVLEREKNSFLFESKRNVACTTDLLPQAKKTDEGDRVGQRVNSKRVENEREKQDIERMTEQVAIPLMVAVLNIDDKPTIPARVSRCLSSRPIPTQSGEWRDPDTIGIPRLRFGTYRLVHPFAPLGMTYVSLTRNSCDIESIQTSPSDKLILEEAEQKSAGDVLDLIRKGSQIRLNLLAGNSVWQDIVQSIFSQLITEEVLANRINQGKSYTERNSIFVRSKSDLFNLLGLSDSSVPRVVQNRNELFLTEGNPILVLQKVLKIIANFTQLAAKGKIKDEQDKDRTDMLVSIGKDLFRTLYVKDKDAAYKRREQRDTDRLSDKESLMSLVLLLATYFEPDTSEEAKCLLSVLIYREIKQLSIGKLYKGDKEIFPVFARYKDLVKSGTIFEARLQKLVGVIEQIFGEEIFDEFVNICLMLVHLSVSRRATDQLQGNPFYSFEKLASNGYLDTVHFLGYKYLNRNKKNNFPRRQIIYHYSLLVNDVHFMTK